jgi:hypothetical protein
MATFKVVILKHRKKIDDSYDVKIRITHNRVQRFVSTPFNVTLKDITAKSLREDEDLRITNHQIEDDVDVIVKRYRNICNELGERINGMTVDQLIDHLQNKNDSSHGFYLDFIAYGKKVAKEMEADGRKGSAGLYITTLNSLVEFIERPTLNITEITSKFMESYEKWLKARVPLVKKEKGTRQISLYCGYVRALHNLAKKEFNDEEQGVINIPFSPFKKYMIQKQPATRKRALSIETLKAFVALPYKVVTLQPDLNRFNFAKDVFILSFCLMGTNTADLFGCEKYSKGWITYNRAKTKDRREDNAEISILVQPEIVPLVEKYRDKTGKRVFNFYQSYTDMTTFNTAVNKGLKKIGVLDSIKEDDLEFYAARHSWATIALNDVGIDKYTIHTALNHVDEDMKVTDKYIRKEFKIINDANRKVLDFLNLGVIPVVEEKKQPKRYTTL